ncbi:acetolactate synthase small subunit [Desulfovibrio aminophilus]|nr:acetolactate synthase small subunit [Desulfovibrio aminophilus]MCM0754922.1 acetolactate synthase small subunit [Desulfovibrio aminophilus]
MRMLTPEDGTRPARALAALRLTVNNHPGVMSHICGLFARRAFNVEGILCTPLGGGATSRIWLLVQEDERLEQMVRQVRKLQDVLEVLPYAADEGAFAGLDACVEGWERGRTLLA